MATPDKQLICPQCGQMMAAASWQLFRGLRMTAPDGSPVNAVRGLLDMIARLIRARHPGRLVACMDADWRPAFRVAAIPSYKAHRANPDGTEQAPDALTALPNVVLTPHTGGHTLESHTAMQDCVMANLAAFFEGRPLVYPVPA